MGKKTGVLTFLLFLPFSFFSSASAGVCLPSHHVQFEGDEICYFIAETPTAYVFDRAIGGSVAAGVLNSQTCESHQPSATTFLFDNSEETKTFIRRLHSPTNTHYPMMLNTGYWVLLPDKKCGVIRTTSYRGSVELQICGTGNCNKCPNSHFTLCQYEAKV